MASLAKLGKGTILRRGGLTSPATYNLIPEVLEIDGLPSGVAEQVSVFNHDSPDMWDETISGKIIPNPMQVRCNYIDDTEQNALWDDQEGSIRRYYEIDIPAVNGTRTMRFLAMVSGYKIVPNLAAQQVLEFTLQPTARPVWNV